MLNRSQLSQNGTGHRQAKHVVAGTGPAYCGPGERVVFLLTGAETGGALFMAEVTIGPGAARHRTPTSAKTRRSACSKGH